MRKEIEIIADQYGYDPQSRQCIEEMAELTQAINKLWRKERSSRSTDEDIQKCRENLLEEIADVQIMLWQMMYMLDADVEGIIDSKLERQIQRINDRYRNV